MSKGSIVEEFSQHLQHAINAANLPDSFYNSFDFTETGRNLCHPITMSLISDAVAKLDGVAHVGIDVRLNAGGGAKFQPDVVGFRGDLRRYVLYVDFESPNSCDTRIRDKDIQPYLKWAAKHENNAVPYIVVTSLPNRSDLKWQFRYPNWLRNAEHTRDEIRKNPLSYWSSFWRSDLADLDLSGVALLNIDGGLVQRVCLQ